jgi:acetyltransferase-like isoleucine patch superfamily enzyme
MYTSLAALHVTAILGLPTLVVAATVRAAGAFGWIARGGAIALAPVLFAALLALVAGLLSRPHRAAVRDGRMARDTSNPDYRGRRLYGLCWTCVYYFPGVYHVCLALPPLKAMLFRLFGYRGSMEFTAYPDTWIRDIALLDLGAGCYVSNRATLGTNIVARGGRIHVGGIKIGARALVGHFAKVGPGAVIGDGAEVGASSGVGMRATIGEGARIADEVTIDHTATVEAGARVGTRSYVGRGARVLAGVTVPPGTIVPAGTVFDGAAAGEARPRPMPALAMSA